MAGGAGSASSALRRLLAGNSFGGVVGSRGAPGDGVQEVIYRTLGTKSGKSKGSGAGPPPATSEVKADEEAAKKRQYKGRNLFEVAQFLPGWGVGAKMAKRHWRPNTFYQITDIKLYKDGRHGAAWGIFHDEGVAEEKAQKIGGVNKRQWRYCKDVPATVWRSLA